MKKASVRLCMLAFFSAWGALFLCFELHFLNILHQ